MKKYTDKELKNIYNDITNGGVYVGMRGGHSAGKITCSCGYIHYQNWGQTASKKTFERFKTSLYIMFSDCDEIKPARWDNVQIKYIAI